MMSIVEMPAMDCHRDCAAEEEIEAFQMHVGDIFQDLTCEGDEVLSLPWVRKLLDSFLICLEEFRLILFNSKAVISSPPLDRMISEFFDRGVKALDVCNAIRDGINQIRHWQKHLEIVLVALDPSLPAVGEGQFCRAKKALFDLSALMVDEKDGGSRSFGRSSHSKDNHHNLPGGNHFRCLSLSVSPSWSAGKQLQAISNNLNAPRGNEILATHGLSVPLFTIGNVLLFVMWTLVASIPCQDRGLQTNFSIPRTFYWAAPILSLHERVLDQYSTKKDRRNTCGVLKEIRQIEKLARELTELVDVPQFPLSEEKKTELKLAMRELAQVCDVLNEELDPLERQIREVFHRIVRSRREGLDTTSGKSHHSE